MNSHPRSNILEPIDPLNISFSQDKCIRTPDTLNSEEKGSSNPSIIIIKDPKELFGQEGTIDSTPPKEKLRRDRMAEFNR